VDIIINNLDDGSHPFHLHGHDFYVLKTYKSDIGWGSFKDGAFPPVSSPATTSILRKDTIMVPRHGHAVIRFKADNEGLWMFHCHLLVHLGGGMAMGFQVGER
jgi:FtsP/CotA-like multicopper oxidase with cupredoxin domain